jgi:hypothetical protein
VIAVCSTNSKVLKKKSYTLQELIELPIALREVGSGTLAVLKRGLSKHKIPLSQLKVKVRLGGTEALKNFLLASDALIEKRYRFAKKKTVPVANAGLA